MVGPCPLLVLCAAACLTRPALAQTANYSVQLMERLAPDNVSLGIWNMIVDEAITQTNASVIADLIEDLAIALRATDDHVREQIDADRAAIDLTPLPPYEDPPGTWDSTLKTQSEDSSGGDLFSEKGTINFLPDGWTEEKYANHTEEDVAALPKSDQLLLSRRKNLELLARSRSNADTETSPRTNPNQHLFASLPKSLVRSITQKLHSGLGTPPGVRAYKRSLAPLVQVLSMQAYDGFGFFVYRAVYGDEEKWARFLEAMDPILDDAWEGKGRGTGMENVRNSVNLLLPTVQDEKVLGGKDGVEDVVGTVKELFNGVKAKGEMPLGLDIGVVLVVDGEVVESLVGGGGGDDKEPFIWAVDTRYVEGKGPEGYNGAFKVHMNALVHDLYVALGSGLLEPVDLWKLIGDNANEKKGEEGTAGAGHDEL